MQFHIVQIVLLLLLGALLESQARIPRLCNKDFDCSNEENPVWASTTEYFEYCEVFRNECLMMSENCDRINRSRPEAKQISKKRCQKLCRSLVCPAVFQPVCGIYNGKKETFGNGCEMNRHICKTGHTYTLHKRRACKQTPIE